MYRKQSEKEFVNNFKDEKDIIKVMFEYYKIFNEKLTSKKYMELFYENFD